MTEALKTIIGEFRTLSPDIASAAVFRLDGDVLAASECATPEQTQVLIAGLNSLTHVGCIGGLERLSIQDINSQVSVAAVGEVYLANVASRMGDQKVIKSLTQVVAPAAIQLALKMPAVVVETPNVNNEKLMKQIQVTVPIAHSQTVVAPKEPEIQIETAAPHMPSTQFMVERIGGLLVASDTVRVDSEVLSGWHETCGKRFTSVQVETLEGKTVTCKFKPQKDGKGTIGIPDKLLQALECEKGKLVMVKPVIE